MSRSPLRCFGRVATGARNTFNRLRYRRLATRAALDEHAVLIDQQHGLSADGNLHYIARELSHAERYGKLSLFFAVDRRTRASMAGLLAARGLHVVPVVRSSGRYYRLLATSKYLVADTSLPLAFVKRADQVYWNTWHGTPLKTLGRAEAREAHLIGNVQKNLACATYLSVPNRYTAGKLVDDYMLEGLGTPQLLFGEYPRNEAFSENHKTGQSHFMIFEEGASQPADLQDNHKTGQSHIMIFGTGASLPAGLRHPGDHETRLSPSMMPRRAYAYLPTFRMGAANAADGSLGDIGRILREVDALLDEDERFFVKLHPTIGAGMDFGSFRHVSPIPAEVELYEFLRLCDVLVTDYSSVLFDFAILQRKVVLFPFDKGRYLAERGLYLPLDSLPFPQVTSTAALVDELRAPKAYDDREFLETYAPYEAHGTTERLCRRVFNDERGLPQERELPRPDGRCTPDGGRNASQERESDNGERGLPQERDLPQERELPRPDGQRMPSDDCSLAQERKLIDDERGLLQVLELPRPDGRTTLVYTDMLHADGRLDELRAALERMARDDAKVFLAFPCKQGEPLVDFLAALPRSVGFIPIAGKMVLTPVEMAAVALRSRGLLPSSRYERLMRNAFAFEVRRAFGCAAFDHVVCLSRNPATVSFARSIPAHTFETMEWDNLVS